MGRDVMIACDFHDGRQCRQFLDSLSGYDPFLKVGMELYYSEGAQLVESLKSKGSRIFLDLKLHDIPNTVKGGMASLRRMGVDMCNLHAAGGKAMMKAALEGLTDEDGRRPMLIAVTQLTSTSEAMLHSELMIDGTMEDVVLRYALNARDAGLDGVVCSPLEVPAIKRECGNDFITVTPGIRLTGDDLGDQARVTTPAEARELGSDYIVVGRSITAVEDPVSAYRQCCEDFIGGDK